MNKAHLKAHMKAAWLDRLQTVVMALVGIAVGVGLLKLSNDSDNVLIIAVAVVFGYGIASLVDDVLTGLLSEQRERLYADADAAGDKGIEAAK